MKRSPASGEALREGDVNVGVIDELLSAHSR